MSTEPETSSPEKRIFSPTETSSFSQSNPESLDQPPTPWIDYAIEQAGIYQKNIGETLSSAFEASRSRLSEIRDTGSAHWSQTIDSLEDVKSNYADYEDVMLAKVKEGASVAASHPFITGGVAAALGFVVLRGPRRFLYYKSLRLFTSEESLLTRADTKVKDLRHSIDVLKAESQQLEKRAAHAEEELLKGRNKLRLAGKQIQSAIGTGYKIEKQARGLKDFIGELPRREASVLRDRVTKLADEAKQERKALSKEITKISNYGISV
ncbi:RGS1-HXK1-interacting protein 1 [Argentina anserina]|uniref:RGS1-HXK1-interacting protein 1 n=1 Tax=Argentina anserina TaxID=57926 RepID=UPI0021765D2E|nr:RGS1-HXK1-interacting protein 1 [Potentilla anserina]